MSAYYNTEMLTSDFDYDLPQELIAQAPAPIRDECRMLVLSRETGYTEDRIFKDIADYLQPGDLLVANETRVRPARLLGKKRGTGGEAEVLLLRPLMKAITDLDYVGSDSEGFGSTPRDSEGLTNVDLHPMSPDSAGSAASYSAAAYWEALVRPGKRLKPGSGAIVDFADDNGDVAMSAEVVGWANSSTAQKGERIVRLTTSLPSLDEALHAVGHAPLPPYIKGYAGDEEMYQTVYSQRESSAAAPTAGLHFTPQLIDRLKAQGIDWETVELEVGLDTFRIVDEENAEDHEMHTEFYTVPPQTVEAIKNCKSNGGRVIAVGTTSVRSLESAADSGELTQTDRAATSLYIMPGYEFKVVDALITNFHVPRSTLMMLVSAFAGRDNLMNAYQHAIEERYRFLSFGDAMFIH